MPLILVLLLLGLGTIGEAAANFNDLNRYAAEVLREDGKLQKRLSELLIEKLALDWGNTQELARESIQTLAESKYTIEFPADKSCNPWPELLETAKYRNQLEAQIDQVADFLSDYHHRNLGRNISFFKIRHVNLRTASRYLRHKSIELDRFKSELTLHVGPVRAWLVGNGPLTKDNLHPLSAKEIKEKWNNGEMWAEDSLAKEIVDKARNPIRGYWPLLNPIGDVRVALREALKQEGLKLVEKIRGWLRQDDLQLQQGLLAVAEGLKNREAASKILKNKSNAALFDIGQKWVDKLNDPKVLEDMANAAIMACVKKQMVKQRETQTNRTQVGLVNVENFHNIDVDFAVGDTKDFQEYVVVPENIEINVTQYGIVNVSTTDRVSVSAALSALTSAGALEKASLASVIKSLNQ